MDSNSFKNISSDKIVTSIGTGIVSTLVANISGMTTGQSWIIGVNLMFVMYIFLWAYSWVNMVNNKLSMIDTTQQTNTTNNNNNNNNIFNTNNLLSVRQADTQEFQEFNEALKRIENSIHQKYEDEGANK